MVNGNRCNMFGHLGDEHFLVPSVQCFISPEVMLQSFLMRHLSWLITGKDERSVLLAFLEDGGLTKEFFYQLQLTND